MNFFFKIHIAIYPNLANKRTHLKFAYTPQNELLALLKCAKNGFLPFFPFLFFRCVSNGSAGVFRFGQSERWPYCCCVCCCCCSRQVAEYKIVCIFIKISLFSFLVLLLLLLRPTDVAAPLLWHISEHGSATIRGRATTQVIY